MTNRIYLSGPIAGVEDDNKPDFARAERCLKQVGFKVINPHDIPPWRHELWSPEEPHREPNWVEYMRTDLAAMLLRADGLAYLDGWETSRGANIEIQLCKALEIPFMSWYAWIGCDPQYGLEDA